MAAPDVRAGFRSWLVVGGNPLLSAVSASAIQFGVVEGFANAAPAILMNVQSEQENDRRDEVSAVIACRCYGGSRYRAAAVTVAQALKARAKAANYNVAVTGGTIEHVRLVGSSDTVDPDILECPVVVVLIEVNMRS